jgi:hypothetical protein
MIDIIKIENGFKFFDPGIGREKIFYFEGGYEILSPTCVHLWTNHGIIFLNLSCTIEGQSFSDPQSFVDFLIS